MILHDEYSFVIKAITKYMAKTDYFQDTINKMIHNEQFSVDRRQNPS